MTKSPNSANTGKSSNSPSLVRSFVTTFMQTATSISGVAFAPTANGRLLDRAQMQQEVEAVLSRRVDLISKRAIDRSSNPIRRL
ncbi:hypothetical protein QUA86_32335 [Microcoleus sp. F6_B6]